MGSLLAISLLGGDGNMKDGVKDWVERINTGRVGNCWHHEFSLGPARSYLTLTNDDASSFLTG